MAWNKDAGRKAAGKGKSPKKEISHVTVKKGASGGHAITHHHTHADHPDETHIMPNDAAMMQHMQSAMGNDAAGPAGAGAAPVDPAVAAAAGAGPQPGAPPTAPMAQ